MKKLYLLLAVVLMSAVIPAKSFAFVNLFCVSDDAMDKTGVALEESFSCTTVTGHRYFVTLEGYGLAAGGVAVSGISITCPNVRNKALGVESFTNWRGKKKKGILKFAGVNAEATAILGGDAGVFMNRNGGICAIAGLTAFGVGFAVDGLVMTIEKE